MFGEIKFRTARTESESKDVTIFGGEARGEAKVTLLLLNRSCGLLEALAEALLDFTGPGDLNTWLARQASPPTAQTPP